MKIATFSPSTLPRQRLLYPESKKSRHHLVCRNLFQRLPFPNEVQRAVRGLQDLGGLGKRIVILGGHAGTVRAGSPHSQQIASPRLGKQPGPQSLRIVRRRCQHIPALTAVACDEIFPLTSRPGCAGTATIGCCAP